MYRASEKFFTWMLETYRVTLLWALDNSLLMLVILLITIALNVVLIYRIPKGFFPQQDTGAIVGGVQGPQDSSFPAMDNSIRQLVGVIKSDPAVANVNAYTGGGGSTNTGFIYIALKPLNERKIGAPQIINRLRPKLNRLPVASAFLQASQDLRIGGRSSNALYQYTIQSDNVQDLSHWGPILLAEMKKIPGLQDVNSDQQNGGLEELLTYDRTSAARLGITAQSLDSALYSAFGQSEVSIIYTQLNQYYVVLEVDPQYWQTPEGLKSIYLRSTGTGGTSSNLSRTSSNGSISGNRPGSGNVPLLAVASSQSNTTPLAVNHTGLFPSVTVSFNLAPGISLSDATLRVAEMQQTTRHPCDRSWLLRRNGTSLSAVSEHGADAGRNGAVSRLHRAGNPLREPGPSPDHHLDAAFGQRRRNARAHDFQNRSQRDFDHWHCAPDRYREEERHYDDRLRARRRTPGRQEHRGFNLRSLHASLPPDLDDDHGRSVRGDPAGVRDRHGLGTQKTAGDHYRRRLDREPDANALYNSCRVSVPRSFAAQISEKARGCAPIPRPGGRLRISRNSAMR